MQDKLVECIPNFSEARRPEIVEAIAEAILAVEGVHILDRHSDLDHNRTVITFVGSPEGVEEAAFRAIARAAESINLDEHSGEHPRIGATDVVPFVPISEMTMEDCVEIAKRLGKRVGEELGIPVYLYEEAATRPERRNLENIRRGEYETLKDEIAQPEREPDFGPAKVGHAGATVIGARQPLIAYNVYLTTDDVDIAKKIAKTVRFSSGGLRYVKGLGLLVEGMAQVSMNLTNYRRTPIALVQETIRREAQRYGVGIRHAELVGLLPQEALIDAAVWYLQLDQFERDQMLETRLQAARQQESRAGQGGDAFLEALASGEPTPGGGSAAAYAGAAGAALAAMVARVTLGKKKYEDVQGEMEAILERAEQLRSDLTAAVQEDAAAFDALMGAYRMPRDGDEAKAKRDQAIEDTTLHAAEVPLKVAGYAAEVTELAERAARLGNADAVSDAASGAEMAQAALNAAGYNVRINAVGLKDPETAQALLEKLGELEARAANAVHKVREHLVSRGGITLS